MSDFGQPYGDPAQRPAEGTPPPYSAPQPAAPQPGAPQYYSTPPQPYGPTPGYPQAFPPPPAPKKSRTGLIIGIVLAVVLVVCVGVAVAGVLVYNARNRDPNPGGSAAAPTQSAKPTTLVDPAKIGDLAKSADQSSADQLRSTLTTGGIEKPFAVVYEDTANEGRQVVLWGGTGRIFGTGGQQVQLNGFFSSAGKQLTGGTISDRAPVASGAVGGLAECEKVSGMGVAMALCAWIGDDALVGFIFTGYTPAEAGAIMPEILSAVVTK